MNGKTNKFNNAIDLYRIKDFDMDDYIRRYLYRIGERDEPEYEVFIPMADFLYKTGMIDFDTFLAREKEEQERSKGSIVHIAASRGVKKSIEKITAKCLYFQDAIIRRACSRKDTMTFSLSSNILKSVIGAEYKRIIEVFIDMGYLAPGSDYGSDEVNKYYYYAIGKYSKLYTLKASEFETTAIKSPLIRKYKEKTKSEYEKMKAIAASKVKEIYGQSFGNRYDVSLKKITINDRDGLNLFIKERIKENPQSKYYYRYVREALEDKNKSITKIDDAGRIYHCLTNLDRELKRYLNIDYMLDCKNSHPLLFNYFISLHHNIDILSFYNISKFLKETLIPDYNNHNVGKFLHKLLIDNNIEKESVARLSEDELAYIFLTSKGQLWDDIAAKHPDKNRDEIKVQMFQEVFYSNTAYAYHWKEYAMKFNSDFPTVYSLIGLWKKRKQPEQIKEYMNSHNLHPEKPTAALSIAMMNLEAQIFTQILKRIYAKRWNAVHIHDCIVVPKDGNKNHPAKEQVEKIMDNVYRNFGLAPTFG